MQQLYLGNRFFFCDLILSGIWYINDSCGRENSEKDDRPLRAPNTTTSFSRSRNFPVPSRSFLVVPGTSFPCCKKESTPQVHCSRSLQVQVFMPLFMPWPSLFMCARRTSAKKREYNHSQIDRVPLGNE